MTTDRPSLVLSACSNFWTVRAQARRPFILETGAVAESVLPDFKEDTWGAIGEYLALERHRYDITAGRLEVQSILIRDGRMTKRDYTQCVYSCADLIRMLAAADLETQALYGSIDKTPYESGCRYFILVARWARGVNSSSGQLQA